jgi:hypothetical protein
MPFRWMAPCVALFVAMAVLPGTGHGQRRTGEAPKPPPFTLGQNVPNPFSADTRIPFTIGDAASCKDPARTYRTSLRVYNLLSQVVAVPVLSIGPNGPAGNLPMEGVSLPCGSYVAVWDGRYLSTGSLATPAIYLYRLEVEGDARTRKLVLAR